MQCKSFLKGLKYQTYQCYLWWEGIFTLGDTTTSSPVYSDFPWWCCWFSWGQSSAAVRKDPSFVLLLSTISPLNPLKPLFIILNTYRGPHSAFLSWSCSPFPLHYPPTHQGSCCLSLSASPPLSFSVLIHTSMYLFKYACVRVFGAPLRG